MLGIALAVMLAVFSYQWTVRNLTAEQVWTRIPHPFRAFLVAAAIFLIVATPVQQRAFIYFQF
jgi:cytochrome c oxidase assembly factor CtaG